ncbi:MAG: nucleotidyltransferase domain-containing protein [Candidatus Micrarchaeia archaeon]|jgi:predicted nucleotidyltransferase
METKVYVSDQISAKWRELAMKRFGYGRGSISKAAEEALAMWIENEEKIAEALDKLKKIAGKEENVLALLLFGSYARKERYHDVDVAVFLENKADRIRILSKLESIVPEYPKFDFTVFNDLPTDMKSRVMSEGVIIYLRPDFDLKRISAELIQKWADIKPMFDATEVQ